MLRRLFARDQRPFSHSVPGTLILCNSPGQALATGFKLLCAIVQYTVNNTTGLGFMKLPTVGCWPGITAPLTMIPVGLTSVKFASTLRSLNVFVLSRESSDAIVQHMSSLRKLHTTTVTPGFLTMSRPGEVYALIEV
jgi:hypothetical protein